MKMKKICIALILITLACYVCNEVLHKKDYQQIDIPPSSHQIASEYIVSSSSTSFPKNQNEVSEFSSSPCEENPQQSLEPSSNSESESIVSTDKESICRIKTEAMVKYIKENLSLWDYTEIWFFIGDDGKSNIEIVTPFPDIAENIILNYTGETIPVQYTYSTFSKGQLEQAKKDLENFIENHPEIEILEWKPILLFDGFQIFLKKENNVMIDFIETYPIDNIYQLTITPDGVPMLPD